MRLFTVLILAWMLAPAQGLAQGEPLQTSAGTLNVTPVLDGLVEPWAFGFLPNSDVLVTERGGRLLLLDPSGGVQSISHGLDIAVDGQGGLLDVMIPRDFAQSREVFLSYATPQGRGSGTALAVGRLADAAGALSDVRVLFELTPGSGGGRHFGSRIVEARDGTLYLTIGDRGIAPTAQNLSVENGSTVRINRDGTVPADNPFVGQTDIQPEIWSFGHRNPQGASLDLSGDLWAVEHGARGGDEVNRIMPGANYGWPVISYGTHYSGAKIGEGTAKAGMEQPMHYWDPSIAPSGMMIYSGAVWSEWRGDIFVGSLKFNYISRLSGATLNEAEQIESDATLRVRDIRQAPDGSIWFLSVGNGALYRIAPD